MKQQTKKRLTNIFGTIIPIAFVVLTIKSCIDTNNQKIAELKARTEQVNKINKLNKSIKVLSESQVEMNKSIDGLKTNSDKTNESVSDTEKRVNARMAEINKQMDELSSKL